MHTANRNVQVKKEPHNPSNYKNKRSYTKHYAKKIQTIPISTLLRSISKTLKLNQTKTKSNSNSNSNPHAWYQYHVPVKGLRLTEGSSWLHHRRRQDLPDLPLIPRAMRLQFLAPNLLTRRLRMASSSGDQGPFTLSLPPPTSLPSNNSSPSSPLPSTAVTAVSSGSICEFS